MRLDPLDPWLFECVKAGNTLHRWQRRADGTAFCTNACGVELTVEETNRCFERRAWDDLKEELRGVGK